jgi:hypothetical protein
VAAVPIASQTIIKKNLSPNGLFKALPWYLTEETGKLVKYHKIPG